MTICTEKREGSCLLCLCGSYATVVCINLIDKETTYIQELQHHSNAR